MNNGFMSSRKRLAILNFSLSGNKEKVLLQKDKYTRVDTKNTSTDNLKDVLGYCNYPLLKTYF
jgi:hypothetical protein